MRMSVLIQSTPPSSGRQGNVRVIPFPQSTDVPGSAKALPPTRAGIR
jgi:hypothetical protein